MVNPQLIDKFANWLRSSERVLLLAHERADGDAIASVLAFQLGLAAIGKRADVVSRDPIAPLFHFLPGVKGFQRDFLIGDYDLIITFDCGDLRRTGFDDRLRVFAKIARRLVNIDHHPKNDLQRLANINLVDYEAAATTQVVYQIFRRFAWPIPPAIATCLLCGLYNDTGGFKHRNTSPAVLDIASDLLGRGARLKDIIRHYANPRSIPTLRLWGIALDRLRCHAHLGIVASIITQEDLRHCQARQEDVAGVVNLFKGIPDMKIAILFAEQPNGSIRASLRTDVQGVDVSRLAALFGGGGLKKASGFSIPGRLIHDERNWHILWN